MTATSQLAPPGPSADGVQGPAETRTPGLRELQVSLLTGGRDAPYAYGLTMALSAKEIQLEVIGGDAVDFPDFHSSPRIHFLNLRGDQSRDAALTEKIIRVLRYYFRLIRYAAVAKPGIFHILWNNKIEFFDRTLLMVYYRLLGKKIALTAHNVNAGRRDANDSLLNRLSLSAQYRMADHIFVHTERMKEELLSEFPVGGQKVSVIPFGINNSLSVTALTRAEARRGLGIAADEKAILFFGHIAPYKGLDCLVDAFLGAANDHPDYRLIIAGAPRPGCDAYWTEIQCKIRESTYGAKIVQRICFVPDEETEMYFKAADVAVLPYRIIFQSGVLFLSYSFGLPVIASDVGSLAEDILPGETGFLCKPDNPEELAATIEKYFRSSMYEGLEHRRHGIREFALARHSWEAVGERTRDVYLNFLRETAR